MSTISNEISLMHKTKYFRPAMVLDVNEDKRLILLRIEGMGTDINTWGRSAVPSVHKFVCGETVLVAGEDIGAVYIIGLLNGDLIEENDEHPLTLKNGTYATTVHAESEKLQVCRKSGELIFEYDPETGKSRVNIQSGDLEFVTKNGSINFISEQDIRFTSKQSIGMESRYGIFLSIKNTLGKIIPSIILRPGEMKLMSPELGITAQRGKMHIEESQYIGQRFSGTFKHAKLIIGRLESIANDVISRARNVYRTVDELTQLKTGRMRTLVRSTLHMKAKMSYLKAEEDFKINADKIHLG